MRRRHSGAVLDPGPEVAWSVGGKLHREPAVAALDSAGRVVGFGSRAILAAARRGSGMVILPIFDSFRPIRADLASIFLEWMTGGCRRGSVVAVTLAADTSPAAVAGWNGLARRFGLEPVVIPRPIAVCSGLDLDRERSHLVAVVAPDVLEVAIVSGEGLVASRSLGGEPELGELPALVRSLLVQVDPDHEADVLDEGIHVVGEVAAATRAATEVAERVGCEATVAADPEWVIVKGATGILQTVSPYLTPRLGRRFRAVRVGS